MGRRGVAAAVGLVLAASGLAVGGIPAVAAPTWSPAVPLSPVNGWGTSPQVVVDSAGNFSAIWGEGAPAEVVGARLPVHGTWTPFVPLADNDGIYLPTVVGDPAGNVTAAWVAGSTLYSARRTATGPWSEPEKLWDADATGTPGLGVDAAGNVSIVFRPNVVGGQVQYRRRTATGSWEPVIPLSAAQGTSPALAVAPNGRLVAVWAAADGVRYRERLADGTWTAEQVRPAVEVYGIGVALTDTGAMDLGWVQRDLSGNFFETTLTHRPAGGVLGPTVAVTAPGSGLSGVQVVADGLGGAVALYKDGPYFTRVREAGTATFSTPVPTKYTAGDGSLNVGPGGLVVLAYHGSDNVDWHVYLSTRKPGMSWSEPTVLGDGAAFLGKSPDVAVDDQGNMTALWEVFKPGSFTESRVYARTLDAAGPVSTLSTKSLLSKRRTFRLGWSAVDRWSAVANHDVRFRSATWRKRSKLSAYKPWRTATTATSGRFKGKAGSTYCFSSRATDTLALAGPWTAETCVVTPLRVSLDSSRKGATLSLDKVKARTIGLLADRLPSGGKVVVRLNGKKVGTVSLKGKKARHKVFLVKTFAKAKAGKVTVTVVSQGRPVRIDGIFLGK